MRKRIICVRNRSNHVIHLYLGNIICNLPSIEDSNFCKVLSSGVDPGALIARNLPQSLTDL